jgi:hypothetical protein
MDGDWTWVEHPVTRLRARIARSALAHHLRSGWTEIAPPKPAPPPQPVQPAPTTTAPQDLPQPAAPAPDPAPAVPDPVTGTYGIPQSPPADPSPQDVPPPGGQNETGE